jgi:hypothetical protein
MDLISGGLPFVEIKDAATDRVLAYSPVISPSEGKWKTYAVNLRTPSDTVAIFIVVRRSDCEAPTCPAFGRLALDNFVMKVR